MLASELESPVERSWEDAELMFQVKQMVFNEEREPITHSGKGLILDCVDNSENISGAVETQYGLREPSPWQVAASHIVVDNDPSRISVFTSGSSKFVDYGPTQPPPPLPNIVLKAAAISSNPTPRYSESVGLLQHSPPQRLCSSPRTQRIHTLTNHLNEAVEGQSRPSTSPRALRIDTMRFDRISKCHLN